MKNNTLISNISFYSFFVKYSLMENYGFLGGFSSRIFKKFIPDIPEKNTIEFYFKTEIDKGQQATLSANIQSFLTNSENKIAISQDLDRAITALSLKIVSYGLDYKFQTYFKKLGINSSCYKTLLYQASNLSKHGSCQAEAFHDSLDAIHTTIKKLRKNKNIIGTSLHLTVVTKNLINYKRRIKTLLDLKNELHTASKWDFLIADYITYNKEKNSLSKYFIAHTDLLALEIVEHTAQKGEKYVADDTKEYYTFFKKGLLGGFIIAIFTLFKILISAHVEGTLPQAFLFSINYALCFIIVFLVGGTIATKQPAMTASTIAKHIDKDGDLKVDSLQDIIMLLRKISRSQFISLMGNFLMALSIGTVIAIILNLASNIEVVSTYKAIKLVNDVFPISGGALYFAAIAGVFLAISGFISGYFDNKVKAIQLAYRIQHNSFLSRFFSQDALLNIALVIERNLGIYAGNISLGFFLGSAFLASYILPFPVDIRHIAFSSANIGYGFVNHSFAFSTIAMAVTSVLFIGLINFIVSFSITFLLVLKSRGVKIKKLGQVFRLSIKDFITNPLAYIVIKNTPKK
ncbi:hypothetical protein ACFSQP_04190 [Bizionia sediminis]|uniref:Site-specific recombinase n=1 Tax=Bizionia sediminis TaxID=1737064 RepID=A0ABW5KQG6_9FLAO